MEKLDTEIARARAALADFDQSDYQLLNAEMEKITALEGELSAAEERWLELSEQLEV